MKITTPELDKKCKICMHEMRFAIQKDLDGGMNMEESFKKYPFLTQSNLNYHIYNQHRDDLITFGAVDYTMRKKGIDIGLTLAGYIEKWQEGVTSRPPEKIKDADALKAMELYSKIQGTLVNKHEVSVRRSVEDALKDFLSESEENETKHLETKKDEIGSIEIYKTSEID